MPKSLMTILLPAAALLPAQTGDRWAPFQFLAGRWKAEGGEFSFQPELNGQILAPKAIYFDTEGHTIRFTVSFPSRNSAVFDSEAPDRNTGCRTSSKGRS